MPVPNLVKCSPCLSFLSSTPRCSPGGPLIHNQVVVTWRFRNQQRWSPETHAAVPCLRDGSHWRCTSAHWLWCKSQYCWSRWTIATTLVSWSCYFTFSLAEFKFLLLRESFSIQYEHAEFFYAEFLCFVWFLKLDYIKSSSVSFCCGGMI